MSDPTTQAALALLERLRPVAETWDYESEPAPGLWRLPGCMDGMDLAAAALREVDYYDATGRAEALERLERAIAGLKEQTTP